jgi:murein DD-endopeptidase MepM/ murein hydrolase activator NlpD
MRDASGLDSDTGPPDPAYSEENEGHLAVSYRAPGPDRGERRWELRGPRLRLARHAAVGILTISLAVFVVLVARAALSVQLAGAVRELEQERERVEALARTLEELEAAYGRLTRMFAPDGPPVGGLRLPSAGTGSPVRPDAEGGSAAGDGPPATWPLTQRGFLTQPLVPADETSAPGHPGIDVAVPSGSYFRSVGPGTVVDRGEDDVYGLYVVVEHAGGYRSLYAHASVVVVEPGRVVREGEVLGLTGSSGQSTAPHLHLEITLDGVHVDPLGLLPRG